MQPAFPDGELPDPIVNTTRSSMTSATFTCDCRTDQGCTCPYPIDAEDDRPAEDDAPNPPYDLPAGVTSWNDWSGA